MRTFLIAVVVAVAFAPAAEAKLRPSFSERVATPGDTVALDLGEGSEQFLGPLRIYLVRLEAAQDVDEEADRRLIKIGELGTPGEFGTPRTLRFEAPTVRPGEYTAAIWFKGYSTGTWANALEGIHPLLTIDSVRGAAASPATSDRHGWPPAGTFALAAGTLLAALGAWGWVRRSSRRSGLRTRRYR